MRILITGASGLLGINLVLEAARQHTVFGVVNQHKLQKPAESSLPGLEMIQADLLKPGAVEDVLDRTQPDWVIHCAALAVVDACEAEPELARQLNTDLPRKLALHVARGGARLVHISTDAVFDGQRGGYSEEDVPNPLGVYARTKLDGERAVAQFDPGAVIARVNLFGWSLTGKRSLAEFFYNNLIAGKQVMGFTDVYFCPLLVNHLAGLLLRMLERDLHGLYHAVGSQCITKYEFGVAIARTFGLPEELIQPTSVQQAGLKAVRSPNLTLKTDKLAGALDEDIPGVFTGIERLYTLYQQGYPQKLLAMTGSSGPSGAVA